MKPGTDAWSVLSLVVERPGQLDAESIGQRLWRPKLTSTEHYLAVRAAIQRDGPEWSQRASKLLHRLQQRGLVERLRPPLLAEDMPPPACNARDWARDICAEHRTVWTERSTGPGGDVTTRAVDLLLRLVRESPGSLSAWVGSAPSGATQRAVAALVAEGIVVPPSYRWPTDAGIALIEAGK